MQQKTATKKLLIFYDRNMNKTTILSFWLSHCVTESASVCCRSDLVKHRNCLKLELKSLLTDPLQRTSGKHYKLLKGMLQQGQKVKQLNNFSNFTSVVCELCRVSL